LLAAQRADHEALEAFRQAFPALIQRAVDLPPDAGSEDVLALKGDLERQYEDSFGLPEDLTRERAALRRLLDLIMKALRRSAGSDPVAQQELADEAEAREIHFRLIEHPLVADLLAPDGPIGPDDLAPAFLSAGPDEVAAALGLFDAVQVTQLVDQARDLMATLESQGLELPGPRQRLALLEERVPTDQAPLH
jgi:hypothetical protein